MRVIFMGTPEFAVPSLIEISKMDVNLVACYTQPPSTAGRNLKLRKAPVQKVAESLGIQVNTPDSLRIKSVQSEFSNLEADVAVVVAYGQLLPPAILNATKFGCYNLHASLLPRWRGAAPINRAIMAGDVESGVSIIKMEENLDSGPICLKYGVSIEPNMTAGELHDKLSKAGSELLVEALDKFSNNMLHSVQQSDEGVTYANKISKSETRIEWTENSKSVHNKIRGLSPIPGAWCTLEISGKCERLKILKSRVVEASGRAGQLLDRNLTVACGTGAVQILELQRAGKRALKGDDFLRGVELPEGVMFN